MQSIKIGWHGRAFAMVKNNENEGKKSRNRISKEERKKMTVSFIQKYQKLNGGSFPSLNLTQKEVGGSFYTTREIVREIIQENKILGAGDLFHIDSKGHSSVEMPSGTILEFDNGKASNGEAASEHEDPTYSEESHTTNNVSSVDNPTHMELKESEVIIVSKGSDEKVVSPSQEIENLSLKDEENSFRKVIISENVQSEMSSSVNFSEDSNAEVVSPSHKNENRELEDEENGSQKVIFSVNVPGLEVISLDASSSTIEDSNINVVSTSHEIENLQADDEKESPQKAPLLENTPSLAAISSDVSSFMIERSRTVPLSEKIPTVVAISSEESSSMIVDEEITQKVPLSEIMPSLVANSSEVSSSMIIGEERSQKVPLSENMSTLVPISSEVSSSTIVEEESSQKVLFSEKVPSLGAIFSEGSSSNEDLSISNSVSEELKNKGERAEINGESDKGKLDRIQIEAWEGSSRQDVHPILSGLRSCVRAIIKYFTT